MYTNYITNLENNNSESEGKKDVQNNVAMIGKYIFIKLEIIFN